MEKPAATGNWMEVNKTMLTTLIVFALAVIVFIWIWKQMQKKKQEKAAYNKPKSETTKLPEAPASGVTPSEKTN